ncbi:hypothetical protein P171DRAFT_481301 [Karstenula rhodostoma CBS 690.94]|uniref:Uncharacterized protein n=1 Tax=Karstenula rhodostoma CBS 690.94 TaxID=1392251 RepID=A0A9P4PRW3_9PLEO|nr:hypothetical protein P171DRAFT_481301 [Karstenula rhodostoma CBS 690.94]
MRGCKDEGASIFYMAALLVPGFGPIVSRAALCADRLTSDSLRTRFRSLGLVTACTAKAGSTIFQAKDAPQYLPGMWATIAMQILYSIVTICMSVYFKRQNRFADEMGKTLEGVEGFRYAP